MAKKMTKKQQRLYELIVSIIVLSMLVIALFKLGIVGITIDKTIRYLFGQFHIVMYLISFTYLFFILFDKKALKQSGRIYGGLTLLFISYLLLSASISHYNLSKMPAFAYFIEHSKEIFNYQRVASGGFFGTGLYSIYTMLFDVYGTYILIGVTSLVGLLLMFGTQIFKVFKLKERPEKIKVEKEKKERQPWFKRKVEKESVLLSNLEHEIPFENVEEEVKPKESIFISISDEPEIKTETLTVSENSSDHLQQLTLKIDNDADVVVSKQYRLPSLTLLDTALKSSKSSKNSQAAKAKGTHLIKVLKEFNIESELIDIHIGPSVTKFEIRPDSSVKISRISSITDNIKMELQAKSIRIEAPIPGKNTVGIEIPNIENTPVRLYEIIKNMDSKQPPLQFALGKDLMGNIIYSDLAKMPHLLVAGATGAGKSVALNAMITTLLLRSKPEDVRLLLIDPKKVEFNSFASAPHLMTPIINEASHANLALQKIVELMDDRYRAFAKINVKNIKAYNEYRLINTDVQLEKLPLLVVIIDELADLMIVAGKEVEGSIQRITQLARAAGIHLIVATQRPSTDVITGIIKANIPSRISFAVSSGIDSRTILDTVGAEKLLGNGDMLYYPVGYSAPVRLQGVFITDEEVIRVANYVGKQPSPDYFDEFAFETMSESSNGNSNFDDALYDDVKAFVIAQQKASTSLIQRNFGIGYNRAARIIDSLEAHGIIGPMSGSKPREVYTQPDPDLDY